LPGCHLAIAGQGPDAVRLRNIADELGLSDRVHFAGELEPARIGDFLAALDAFVFPSSAETFGLAAVEAAQAGVPVIANDIPVLREVLEIDGAACARFVDTSDPHAFAEAVSDVLGNPKVADALSQLGRRLSERHSLAAMVEAYRELVLPGREPDAAKARTVSGTASTSVS
jgi:glycosyltransferase involved in cell wall biosynthesis